MRWLDRRGGMRGCPQLKNPAAGSVKLAVLVLLFSPFNNAATFGGANANRNRFRGRSEALIAIAL